MKLKTKNNFLSAYGFSCGYVEKRESDVITLELYREHNIYHVKYNRFDIPYSLRKDCKGWETFENLKQAKKRFFKLCEVFNFNKIK